jgi:cell division protein FtsQ
LRLHFLMSLPASIPPPSRSWKDIRQGVNPRAMSKEGHRRRTMAGLKFAAVCAFGLGGVVAAIAIYLTWESNPASLKDAGGSLPLKQVVFSTDGVLDRAWLDRTLALPKRASLMSLDLAALERRLLGSGQAQSVVLRRRFADNSLVVAVQERAPVARLMAQVDGEAPRLRLVARDGVVYEGVGYEPAALDRLPWLAGVRLRRSAKSGIEPIAEMERTAQLLQTAESLVPKLFAGWQVVSLARLASDEEILVRSTAIPEIVFDARNEFPRQLARLDYIVDFLHSRGAPPLQRIDLALGGQVPVELQETVPLKPAGGPPHKTVSQPKQRRDF